jgi:hypothetical protein
MEMFDCDICQKLKQEIEFTDSIKTKKVLAIKYLNKRVELIERIISQNCIDDVDYESMLDCLWNDLKLAVNMIKL